MERLRRESVTMTVYDDLRGKVVLLTGGSNGIGAATVRAFHGQGASVHFCDKDENTGRALAEALPACSFRKVDLTREREIQRWINEIKTGQKRVDVLVNNAAIDPRIPLQELTAERWDTLSAINLRSYFLLARECAALMDKGSIVNLSSITFHTAPAAMSAYVATKAGIIGLTRSLARELGPRRIRVNTVSPGWVMTERQLREYVDASTKRLIKRSQCAPELLQPVDIAEVILFLASDASRAITGQELLADRGWAHS
jgi:NAD(P)-dependent dehydrogenase (short-subunit alcohol dehydrogenase family)